MSRRACNGCVLHRSSRNCESGGAQRQAQAVSQANVLRTEESFDRRHLAQITQSVQRVETLRKQAIDRASLKPPLYGNSEEHTSIAGKLNRVLDWLNAWKCRDIHERTTLLRQPDTCTWLPNTKSYQAWRNGVNSFLWLNGKGRGLVFTNLLSLIWRSPQPEPENPS